MATPNMLVQSLNATLRNLNAGSFRINTFNPDGSVLDVSSGYTLNRFGCHAASDALTSGGGGYNLTSDVSAAFDATGLTISWTAAQANTIFGLLQTIHNTAFVEITNDSGTTHQFVAIGQLTVSDPDNLGQ